MPEITEADIVRAHCAADIGELKGEMFRLKERLKFLLSDAKDALEIDPPALHVALRRIYSARKMIGD